METLQDDSQAPIYAGEYPLEKHTVQRAGLSLEIVGVEMSGKPRDLEAQVRSAATRLSEQAAESRSQGSKGDGGGIACEK